MATLREQFAVAKAEALRALEAGDLEKGKEMRAKAETYMSAIAEMDAVNGLDVKSASPVRPDLPGMTDADPMPKAQPSAEEEVNKAINVMRYGEIDGPTNRVMQEIYGGDYRQVAADQERAFARYMRRGEVTKGMNRQTWDIESVKSMLRSGMTVAEIKSTMVEGQDILGGYAVPPQVYASTISRLPGLTAIRGSGALVIQTSSNMIEWLKITGGTDPYVSGMRGYWGGETQDPSETNFTIGLMEIPVKLYTYKVPMSVSLLEDASNVVDVFTRLVSDTLASDEDTAFTTGDGANKPRGLLPGSANAHSFTEVVSGAAATLTYAGLKNLRRGVQAQYRSRGSWLGNSDTAGVIEGLLDGEGRNYIEFVDVGAPMLRSTWRETEAMPDVSAGTFPLLYGDMSGYAIIERLGLAIQRYNDSNTTINKVEFQVRRRIGGNVVEPWKFAVQKVAAS
jgi:HK97 family phage major capsid protein